MGPPPQWVKEVDLTWKCTSIYGIFTNTHLPWKKMENANTTIGLKVWTVDAKKTTTGKSLWHPVTFFSLWRTCKWLSIYFITSFPGCQFRISGVNIKAILCCVVVKHTFLLQNHKTENWKLYHRCHRLLGRSYCCVSSVWLVVDIPYWIIDIL